MAKYNAVDGTVTQSASLIENFTPWSCITLCVDFKWLNKLVISSTMIFVCCPKCFRTTEFALPFLPSKGCISAIIYRLLLHVFFKTRVHRWGWNGSLHLPHKTRRGAERSFYYDYLVFMIEGSQNRNRNWNSTNRPDLGFSAVWSLRGEDGAEDTDGGEEKEEWKDVRVEEGRRNRGSSSRRWAKVTAETKAARRWRRGMEKMKTRRGRGAAGEVRRWTRIRT